jgi:hypothetical protein
VLWEQDCNQVLDLRIFSSKASICRPVNANGRPKGLCFLFLGSTFADSHQPLISSGSLSAAPNAAPQPCLLISGRSSPPGATHQQEPETLWGIEIIFLRPDLLAAELRIMAWEVWGWSTGDRPWQPTSFVGIDKNRERDRDE